MPKKTKKTPGYKEGSADDKRMDRIEKKYGVKEGSRSDEAIDRAMRGGRKGKR